MSFRWRLYLSLALAVLVGTMVEALLDYSDTRQQLEEDVNEVLQTTLNYAEAAISLENGNIVLLDEMKSLRLSNTHLSVIKDDAILLEVGEDLPDHEGIVTKQHQLSNGLMVEASVDKRIYERILNESLRSDLSDDGIQVLLSVIIVWVFAGFLLRPIRELTRAVNDLSQQRFPEPVKVPPGKDALAQLASSFNRMSANIKAAIDRERAFTRYSSHELRTPLSAIKLKTELMELGMTTMEESVPVLTRNINRMQRVLEALLGLARASERDTEPISIEVLSEETIKTFPEEAQMRIQMVSKLKQTLKVANPHLVGQAILNLLDNAVKYTSNDITLTLESHGDSVKARINDKGEGVPEEVIEKLTDKFFRLSSHVEGSGLGLAFVKHIVRTFGGDLKLCNTQQGFEVTLIFPVAKGY